MTWQGRSAVRRCRGRARHELLGMAERGRAQEEEAAGEEEDAEAGEGEREVCIVPREGG